MRTRTGWLFLISFHLLFPGVFSSAAGPLPTPWSLALLEKGAREYVNHARGADAKRDRLYLSSIYKWFQEDFGGSEESVVHHLQRYAMPELAEKLSAFDGKVSYGYDWRINGTESPG